MDQNLFLQAVEAAQNGIDPCDAPIEVHYCQVCLLQGLEHQLKLIVNKVIKRDSIANPYGQMIPYNLEAMRVGRKRRDKALLQHGECPHCKARYYQLIAFSQDEYELFKARRDAPQQGDSE